MGLTKKLLQNLQRSGKLIGMGARGRGLLKLLMASFSFRHGNRNKHEKYKIKHFETISCIWMFTVPKIFKCDNFTQHQIQTWRSSCLRRPRGPPASDSHSAEMAGRRPPGGVGVSWPEFMLYPVRVVSRLRMSGRIICLSTGGGFHSYVCFRRTPIFLDTHLNGSELLKCCDGPRGTGGKKPKKNLGKTQAPD